MGALQAVQGGLHWACGGFTAGRGCRYKALSQLGDGSYGSVWKAIHRETGEVVRASTPHLFLQPSFVSGKNPPGLELERPSACPLPHRWQSNA